MHRPVAKMSHPPLPPLKLQPTHSFDILIHLKFLLIHPRDKMRNPEVFEDDPGKYEILHIY